MYKELTDDELLTKLSIVDKLFNSNVFNSKELLHKINNLFPLDSVMPETFKGSHCITLKDDGKLQLGIWCNNKIFTIVEN